MNVAPAFTAERTSIQPPCSRAMPPADAEAEAGALADLLRGEDGSKMRSRVASSMPVPLSFTSIAIHARPSRRADTYGGAVRCSTWAAIPTTPPLAGIAWIALTTRLVSTWVS